MVFFPLDVEKQETPAQAGSPTSKTLKKNVLENRIN